MLSLILGVLASVIATEFYGSLPLVSRWLVLYHASKLPDELAERQRKEWLAELAAQPSHFFQIYYAVGLFRGIDELVRVHREYEDTTIRPPILEINVHEAVAVSAGVATVRGVGTVFDEFGMHIVSNAELYAPSITQSPGPTHTRRPNSRR